MRVLQVCFYKELERSRRKTRVARTNKEMKRRIGDNIAVDSMACEGNGSCKLDWTVLLQDQRRTQQLQLFRFASRRLTLFQSSPGLKREHSSPFFRHDKL